MNFHLLPAEGGLPRSSNSKQQAASKQAKVYVCMYVYVREYELRSRNLIGGGPVLTGREWQAWTTQFWKIELPIRDAIEEFDFWGSGSETNTCKISDFEITYLTGALKWAPCKICECETVYLTGTGIRQGQELQWGCVRYQVLKSYILQGR